MADAAADQPKASTKDPVSEARVWTDYCQTVTKNQIQIWPSRWEWLVDENRKMYEAMAGKRPLSPYDWSRWYRPPTPCPNCQTPTLIKTARWCDRSASSSPKCRTSLPSPRFPRNGWYGFKPKVQGRSLVTERQKWCKVTCGQHNLPRVFGWPDIFD